MNLRSIAANLPFLDTLAQRWLAGPGDRSRGMILLPTRRAARALADAFLRASGGAPLLLPRITALGALDETPLALTGALDLAPPVPEPQRLAALSRMVMALPEADGGARSADRAWMLARELAALMDEAERAELDLPVALEKAIDAAFAEHWQITLRFLGIVTREWPLWLTANQMANPAQRRVHLLNAQAAAWRAAPPEEPVWIAGTTAAIPAVARLLGVVARMPHGLVVLPGLDHALGEDAWAALDDSHPQAALRHLLHGLGASRADVQTWDGDAAAPASRVALLSRALLPAAALTAWRETRMPLTAGLTRLDAADQQEEAAAIALILRDALDIPGRRAALVTPDRALAGRVAAELLRWGVVADDSAGEPLAHGPPAVFLRLLARTVADGFAPVPLLALLKHPLAAAGQTPAQCRAAARALERAALRGPRPKPGLTALRRHAGQAERVPPTVPALLDTLQTLLRPVLEAATAARAAPATLLAALLHAAEALAGTEDMPGAARLWAHEEGEALSALLAESLGALALLPDQPPAALPGLLDALLEGAMVRTRRALRGRDATAEHPRVFIWGLLEARLQAVDVVVLGSLAEGVWPPAAEPGPWLSRPMRKAAGLPSPEERVGLAAHDFVQVACAAPYAVLSCPRRRDGAPTVPSRWLARLDAFLTGHSTTLASHPAAHWAQQLDRPAGGPRPVSPPQPRPQAAQRPRRLSVTEIETLLADPYAIYARHVLKLRPLDPLEQETDALDYGALVHKGIEIFLNEQGAAWPADGAVKLREAMETALAGADVRAALAAWWRPRLHRIADWVGAREAERRAAAPPVQIASELRGDWRLPQPLDFVLRGVADRIERRADGSVAILDYKTGTLPTQKDVANGSKPQLPLEAAMALAGAFGNGFSAAVAELTYWQLTGGFEPGKAVELYKADRDSIAAAAADAAQKLAALITAFDDATRAYLATPHPDRMPRFSDYGQLSRRAEWDMSGDGE
jgi:ATP-dependent helicase/nuclease subunit B